MRPLGFLTRDGVQSLIARLLLEETLLDLEGDEHSGNRSLEESKGVLVRCERCRLLHRLEVLLKGVDRCLAALGEV